MKEERKRLQIATSHRSYFHHEQDGVENDEGHDEVLEGCGDDHFPDLVLEAVALLGHVSLQRGRLDGEVDARLLLSGGNKMIRSPGFIDEVHKFTWFLSISPSCSSASPCSWKVMMMRATKMLTKKKGKTMKKTM